MHIRTIILVIVVCLTLYDARGQNTPLADFTFPSDPYNVCLGEPVKIDNRSENALHYLWDFCAETFTETPSISDPVAIPGLLNGWGYKVVKHGDQWTGFLLSRNTNKLFRLEFGSDPSTVPVVSDLGNPGNLLVSPQGLDIVEQNGNWYAFIGKGETTTGQVVRLDFGSNLHSTPTAVGLGNFGTTGRFRDVKVIKQNFNWILLLVLDTQHGLLRINYGNSLTNAISAANISTTGALPGANLPLGFSVTKYNGNWIVHTVSFSNNGIQQYNFGTDILGTASLEGHFTFSSIAKPYYIKVIREADSFYGFVGNESKKLSIINFGDFTSPPQELPNSALPAFIGFDVLKSESKNIIHGTATGGTSFSQVSFENTACPSPQTWTDEATPSNFSYDVPGSYAIELGIEGSDAQYDVASQTIKVSSLSAPAIGLVSDNACLDASITFEVNSSVTLSEWAWDLGDNTVSSDASPLHTYGAPGDYPVTVDVRDINNCSNTAKSLISIYPSPDASFQLPATLLCTNNDHLFTNATPDIYDGNLSYQWFIDDNQVGTDRDLQYNFTTTGPKEIRLVTSIPGCTDEKIVTTSPVEVGPIVDFSFTGVCEGDLFSFEHEISDPVESYLWDFGTDTSDDENPSRTFSPFGDFTVSLTATNAVGCENTKTKTVTVHSKPLVSFNISGPPNTCSGSPTLFQNQTTSPDGNITGWLWDFDDPNEGTLNITQDPEHVFQTPGTYSVNLTATTAAGCASSGQKDVLIHESPSTDLTYSPACEDVPVLFTAPPDTNITNAYWEIGTSYYEESAPTHTFRSAGDYPLYLEVTATNGCVAKVNKTIQVPGRLNADFSVSKNCVNQAAILTDITTGADAVLSHEWTVNGNVIPDRSPLVYTFTQEGPQNIRLKVTTEAGCIYEVSRQVPVYVAPVASFSTDKVTGAYPLGVKFTNTSTGATHFRWEFLDGTGATSTETSPHYTFGHEGAFDVVLTALNDQECEDTSSARITTIPPAPNADIELITLAENPDGSMKLIVTIHNKGNTILQDVPLDVDFSGNVALRQMLEDPVLPGNKYNIVLTTGILSLESLHYLCVDLAVNNDLSPAGNRMCRKFGDNIQVFPSYPNPTSSSLTLEWISAEAATIRITLTDGVGRTVLRHLPPSSIGLNHLTIDLGSLQSGLYHLLIHEGDKTTRQRIVVSR